MSEKASESNKVFKHFLEDLHFSYVEYGGSNITHWNFLNEENDENDKQIEVESLCGRAFVIADDDSSGNTSEGDIIKKAKTLRHQKFSTYLKDRYNKLNVYEIENLLTPEVIKKTVSYFESNKDSIAEFNSFSQESYSKIPLGRFLDSNIINKKVKSYSADSGTIKRKLEFAKEAISHVKCKEDISDEAWELAEKVYNFIKQNNN